MNLAKDFTGSENPYFGADQEEEDLSTLDRGDTFEEDGEVDDDTDNIEVPTTDEPEGEQADEKTDEDSAAADAETGETDAEADPETDSAAEDKPAAAEVDSDKKRSPTIPRTRFDEVNTKLQRAKERIDELERLADTTEQSAAQEVATQESIDYEKEVMAEQGAINQLLLDGDTEEASKRQFSLTQKMMTKVAEQARSEARQEVSYSTQQAAYSATLTDLETRFPFINPDVPDSYDESMVTRVRSISRSLVREEGYSKADALAEAAETVAARYHPELLKPAAAPAAASQPTADVAAKQAARKEAGISAKLDAAGRQPPKPGGASTSSERDSLPSINDMSEDEFAALSQKEIARLRGDVL